MGNGYSEDIVVDTQLQPEGTCDNCNEEYCPLAHLTEGRSKHLMDKTGIDPEQPSQGVYLCRPCYGQFKPILLEGVSIKETPTKDAFKTALEQRLDDEED